ncbi:MAG: heme-binding protein [Terracoccus sp.]
MTTTGTTPASQISRLSQRGRRVEVAQTGDPDLGPLRLLPGTWRNVPGRQERGWNMIALPFAGAPANYRLLVNEYTEELKFSLVDKAVPNRGITANLPGATATDQLVVTLDYEQMIAQSDSTDFPVSGLAGGPGQAIHHEPGLFLHMLNECGDLDLARLAAVPHGDTLLALGRSRVHPGKPEIPKVNGLPSGRIRQDLTGDPYFAPYHHFRQHPFTGTRTEAGFPGFDPSRPDRLLRRANQGVAITQTTELMVDSELEAGGVSNIPFIVRQAKADSVRSTFWIQELEELDATGQPRLRLQYLQVAVLDFFSPRGDGLPGLARWPHVSINTLEKVVGSADATKASMPA